MPAEIRAQIICSFRVAKSAEEKQIITGKIQSAEINSKSAMLGNKSVYCAETGKIYESVKMAASEKCKQKSVGRNHFKYSSSVETSRDECSGVGEKMSCSSKCTATKVEEIVRAAEIANLQN